MSDICEVKRCTRPMQMLYGIKEVCEHHWAMHCDGRINLKDNELFRPRKAHE